MAREFPVAVRQVASCYTRHLLSSVRRNLCSKKTDEEDEDEDTHESKLEVHFFSFTTFYYLVSL